MRTPLSEAVIGGRYEPTGQVLGVGGMGRVIEAHDTVLRRPVAIKMLDPMQADHPDRRRRFEHEAFAAAALNHPNIVAVFDIGEHDDVPYIVMERLDGRTIRDELDHGPLRQRVVRRVGLEVLGALAHAHDLGLIHRDIKPGNLLLTFDGRIKVADFGIAKSAGSDLTRTKELFGTPCYLAPEMLRGEPANPQTDVFAVGVSMYEMLTGTKPFAADTPWATLVAIERGEHRPLLEVVADLDSDLAQLVERAMSRDPEIRFRSAGEMVHALSSLGRHETTRLVPRRAASRNPGATDRLPAATATATSRTAGHPVTQRIDVEDTTEWLGRPTPTFRLFPWRRGVMVSAIVGLMSVVLLTALVLTVAGEQPSAETTIVPVAEASTEPDAASPPPAGGNASDRDDLRSALDALDRAVGR